MSTHYSILFGLIAILRPTVTSRIEVDIPSIASSHTFELASNHSQSFDRDALFGLVDGTSSSIPSSILVRASYEQVQVQRYFNFYETNQKPSEQQRVGREPIFRSYLLASTFNRSYPFIRVLVATARGSYEDLRIEPLCAIVTAVNEQNLYASEACLVGPGTGYCLVTISVLKMVELTNRNQTTNKIELYLKLHHVAASNQCLVDQTPRQDHIHHETRIGHAEYLDNDHLLFSTMSRSSVSIDYSTGVHYPGWFFLMKLKLILSSTLAPSFIIRGRLPTHLSIHSIQTNIPKISNSYIQILYRQSSSDIDFNVTMNQTSRNDAFEIDLATIILVINATNFYRNNPTITNIVSSIDWFLLSSSASYPTDPILRVPVQVHSDDIQTIVALHDHTRLINTAILSMQAEQFPLRILAVNYSGDIQPISQAVCHSENVYLIQVDANCNHIYFSGQERDDFFDHINSPTSIVIRYDKHFQRAHFTIYIPERPLSIELSDPKLSRINGWFVTNRDNDDGEQKNAPSHHGFDGNEHDDDDASDEDDDDDEDVKCYPVYQQSLVHVYTKFYRTTPNGDRIYLFNKLNVLVTSLVRAHLETDNPRVAIIKGDRVIGVGAGKTNVRIYPLANKVPIGSKTIHVDDSELIRIEKVSFNLISNIDLQASLIEHVDPVYRVLFRLKPVFNRLNLDDKNQFGQLNVMLTYSDNTSVSLGEIPSDYYQLDIPMNRKSTLLIHVNSSSSWRHLQFRASVLGRASIHARLKLGQQQCTDDRSFSQNDLSCDVFILSSSTQQFPNDSNSASNFKSDHYVILNHSGDHRAKTSPFLIGLSIVLGACIVLFVAFLVHWLVNLRYHRKSLDHARRQRHATQSGAEEANHDWIFLDRNSLEMPMKQQQHSPSIHSSTLHITSNPLINASTLQRQQELSELSHSQMLAYFENLKESHA